MMGSEKETDSVESERSVESPEGYENCVVESVVTSGMGWNTSHAAGGSAGASSGAGAGGAGVVAAPPVPSVAASDVEMSGSAKVRVSRSAAMIELRGRRPRRPKDGRRPAPSESLATARAIAVWNRAVPAPPFEVEMPLAIADSRTNPMFPTPLRGAHSGEIGRAHV